MERDSNHHSELLLEESGTAYDATWNSKECDACGMWDEVEERLFADALVAFEDYEQRKDKACTPVALMTNEIVNTVRN